MTKDLSIMNAPANCVYDECATIRHDFILFGKRPNYRDSILNDVLAKLVNEANRLTAERGSFTWRISIETDDVGWFFNRETRVRGYLFYVEGITK